MAPRSDRAGVCDRMAISRSSGSTFVNRLSDAARRFRPKGSATLPRPSEGATKRSGDASRNARRVPHRSAYAIVGTIGDGHSRGCVWRSAFVDRKACRFDGIVAEHVHRPVACGDGRIPLGISDEEQAGRRERRRSATPLGEFSVKDSLGARLRVGLEGASRSFSIKCAAYHILQIWELCIDHHRVNHRPDLRRSRTWNRRDRETHHDVTRPRDGRLIVGPTH